VRTAELPADGAKASWRSSKPAEREHRAAATKAPNAAPMRRREARGGPDEGDERVALLGRGAKSGGGPSRRRDEGSRPPSG